MTGFSVETPEAAGDAMHGLMRRLFPICRSLTGEGVRETFRILRELGPLETHEVPSGTQVLDWIVPDEWNIRDAYVADEAGNRVIDFRKNNLHVVGYSEPVDATLSLDELRPHLHSLPDQPDAIPYLTSYYARRWGFCLRHPDLEALKPGSYRAVIDSTLEPGSLTYADWVIPGESDAEVLLATNVCHPSMANNELSGPVTLLALGLWLQSLPERRYTYRLAFLPETIGAVAYLDRHLDHLKAKVVAGYQVICTGGPDDFTYLLSRDGNTLADRAALNVLAHDGRPYRVLDHTRRASDERQWCSPGAGLPVGSLMRSKYHDYAEYHTSLDDLDFVRPEHLAAVFDVYCKVLRTLEMNRTWKSTLRAGEPQLGRRGLYPSMGGRNHLDADVEALSAVLGYADGQMDMIAIADAHGRSAVSLAPAVEKLYATGLIREEK
jgi:aminopeptidase-like protein